MTYTNIVIPQTGKRIAIQDGKLQVPENPIIPFIEGDGSGPDIWRAASRVINAAIEKAYHGSRQISWMEVYAGEKAHTRFDTWLPDDTITAFREFLVGIKGPLTTPIGGGFRSINVALRKELDLYSCQRPVRWFQGVPSPVKHPEYVDMVIFRENTEDLYSGIEFERGSEANERFKALLKENFPNEFSKVRFPDSVAFGVKPISEEGSKRLIRSAIRFALENHRRNVTLVHKGNIMKFTEGAFRNWGYEVARQEFADYVFTLPEYDKVKSEKGEDAANLVQEEALKSGRLLIKDMITDALFERTITRARDFDVIATTNLNGDYLSDALAAQVGGLGIAPGANINYESGVAVFEATHGTAPRSAGKDRANPSSVILSGEMMLRYLGWNEAATQIIKGIEGTMAAKTVTNEMFPLIEGGTLLKTTQFGDAIIQHMDN
ncbi:MAG TPA: NADP-dependent isocitrate dehydrogenase [Anaerolineaceae bacterium]|jgi:isocitrate dehydrogenase